jgi:asparagine synthase (glutamine-hydrolysing)
MCGITILWGPAITDTIHETSLRALHHRGPDAARRIVLTAGVHVGFSRLHIQGAAGAEQPFQLSDGRTIVVNGEIYNAEILRRQFRLSVPDGASDCAVIPAFLQQHPVSPMTLLRQLDGEFACAVVDPTKESVWVSRDPYGVRPLYIGSGPGWMGIVSEPVAFPPDVETSQPVEPGKVVEFSLRPEGGVTSTITWHAIPWLKVPRWRACLTGLMEGGQALQQALEEAVTKRLVGLGEVGVVLTGGVGSAIVAALAARILRQSGRTLHTYAAATATMITAPTGSTHHILETVDAQSIARTTPSLVVLLTDAGADELFGGCPDHAAAQDDLEWELATETLLGEERVVEAEIEAAAAGLELRAPFYDRQVVAVARALPTDALRHTGPQGRTKTILRTAFAETGLLPPEILWTTQ